MRTAGFVAVALSVAGLGPMPAAQAADSGPVIVVPGRHGLPVFINGFDASGAVVEGDFGLYRPQMVNPTIIAAPVFIPPLPYRAGYDRYYNQNGYFPALGHQPGYGRHEVEPPPDRKLPPPAQSFRRSWTSHSDPVPASLDPPAPPMLIAPQIYPDGRRGDDGKRR